MLILAMWIAFGLAAAAALVATADALVQSDYRLPARVRTVAVTALLGFAAAGLFLAEKVTEFAPYGDWARPMAGVAALFALLTAVGWKDLAGKR